MIKKILIFKKMSKVLISEDKMKELAKSVSADEVSFVSFYKIFQALYETHPATQYTNYFHGVSLFELEKVNKINNQDSFFKAIASFINEVSSDKKKLYKIYLEFTNEESVKNALTVLKMVKEPKSFFYILKISPNKTEDIDFLKHTELFNYIDTIDDPQFFNDFVQKIIEEKIDVAKLYYVNLDNIATDKVLEYCTKYPNRIKELYAFENKDYEKIQKICELNAETLIRIPNCKLDLYSKLKKVEIVTINSEPLPEPLPENFNYASVKNLETIALEDDSDEKTNFALELINKCPNVEKVSFAAFCELTPEQFIKIFSQTSSNKIKEIMVTCQEFEDDIDLSPIFKNLPKLTKFRADCHCSMDYLFGIQPVISCEKVAPSYPIIEQLITNYLKDDEDNYITGDFPNDFEPFNEYFKNKPEIMNRFNKITGDAVATFEVPYCNELIISDKEDIANIIAKKVGTVHLMCPLDDDIKKFLEKVKPDFIKLSQGKLDDNLTNATKIVYCVENNEIKC